MQEGTQMKSSNDGKQSKLLRVKKEQEAMSRFPIQTLSLRNRLFFGMGEVDWEVERLLIEEE